MKLNIDDFPAKVRNCFLFWHDNHHRYPTKQQRKLFLQTFILSNYRPIIPKYETGEGGGKEKKRSETNRDDKE